MSNGLDRLEQLFHEAAELPSPEKRAEYLARACAGDAALQRRVEKLLRAHATVGRFLDPNIPAPPIFPESSLDSPPEKPGDQIGRYSLVECIGEGGSCIVYRADQTIPVRREVALKLIKAGMDTRQVVARFEGERQALALMDHPHIAKVFDAGVTPTGRPYFVMELVRGIPVTRYCNENGLTLKQRLELFIQVCQAVQHAHQKGIIHRDLKPSNILVTTSAAEHPQSRDRHQAVPATRPRHSRRSTATEQPAPKIIDFGIAKAMQAPLKDQAVVTWAGQFVGTPAYMSPDQAAMNSEDLDVRSDVYSLGTLLYELLTGATPFDQEKLSRATFDEIRHTIRESEPLKPSARLAELAKSQGTHAEGPKTNHLYQRPEGGEQTDKELRGDLDCIVMKALDKDRARRYATANDFAEDVLRYLAHEPVLAMPPSAPYQARKFMRRHRVGVTVALAITLATLAGLSLALMGLQRARRAEAVARHERDRAVQTEQRMHLERDRAIQAEADTQGILSLFDERLGTNDTGLDLYYAAARLARQRLNPTNVAAINFILPLGRNLGRRGAWRDTVEVYDWLSEAVDRNCDLRTQAHAAALLAVQPAIRHGFAAGLAKHFGNTRDPLVAMQVARSILISPDSEDLYQVGFANADRAFRELPNHPWCRVVLGMADCRRRRWLEAIEVLQGIEGDPDPQLTALANCFAAMARHQAGQSHDARATLHRASRQLQQMQRTGLLPGNEWHLVVFGLVARAEAERLILGSETSPAVTVNSLAEAREKWRAVREDLTQGEALALEGKWDASRNAYVRALDHPAFDWQTAEEESTLPCLSLQMSTVLARAGDNTNHERLCRLLLKAGLGGQDSPASRQVATARAERYARACLVFPRQPAHEIRQIALDLARFAVSNQERQRDHHAGWTRLAAGIAELDTGDPARALKLLDAAQSDGDTTLHTSALAYRALALNRLNRKPEAVQVLQDAEKLFGDGVSLGSSSRWWDTEQRHLALQQARQAVRPESNEPDSEVDTTTARTNVVDTELMVSPSMALPAFPREAIAIAAGGRHCLALRANGTVVSWGDHTSGQTSMPAAATNVLAIAAGLEHSLALRSNGTLLAWGNNAYGQANIPAHATNLVAVAAGHYHSLALRADGTAITWGAGSSDGFFPSFGQSRVPTNATRLIAVAAGSYHSLALRTNGTLVAWGLNGDGQCDIPPGATNLIAIAAGHGHNLVLKRDGTLLVWGNNKFKDVVVGITNVPPEATNITAIAAGAFHCLALRADGRLFAWGLNKQRQCVVPLTASGAQKVCAGFFNSLALSRDGTIVAWGGNDSRQCLVPPSLNWERAISAGPTHLIALRQDGTIQETITSTSDESEADPLPLPAEATNIVAITAGQDHRLALRADGKLAAWGENSRGQCLIPPTATNVTAVSAGDNHCLALRGDGTLVAWGDNRHGQTNVPAGLTDVVAIAAGHDSNLALSANGAVRAWGSTASVPSGLSNVVALSVGVHHNLALRGDGTVVGWGGDGRGQCSLPTALTNVVAISANDGFGLALRSDGTVVWLGYSLHAMGPFDSRNPIALSGVTAIARSAVLKRNGEVVDLAPHHHTFAKNPEALAAIAAGAYHNLALPRGGRHEGWVHAWGENQQHQGAGYTFADPPAEWVPRSWLQDNFVGLESPSGSLLTNALSVAAGARHSLALRTDGTVIGWGDNSDGQASPPPGLSNLVAIAAGNAHSLAVKTDGSVVGWGSDALGQRNPPSGMSNVLAVAAGARHSLALQADGRVVAWGDNTLGQRAIPADLSNVVAIAAGDYHSLALKNNGTVVGWGAGRPGTFGKKNYHQATIPDGLTNVVAIAAGRYHSLALLADGKAIGWGDNYRGQCSVPAGATNLIAIAAGRYHSLFLKATATATPEMDSCLFRIRRPARFEMK